MSSRTMLHVAVWILGTLLALGVVAFFLYFQNMQSTDGVSVNMAQKDDVEEMTEFPLPTPQELSRFGTGSVRVEPNYYTDTVKALKASSASFIEANLTTMKINAYQEGVLSFTVDIKTKGRPGSWWQTPAGVYHAQTKKQKHFSSFGHVYTDWNLPFQGNFFIHGWPYDEDGTPVPQGFSGGCIRLTDEDAQRLYEFAEVGTPIIVYEDYFASDNFSYEAVAPVDITAASYLAMDIRSNDVILEQHASSTFAIASITKIMTALIATEYINLDKNLTVSARAATATTSKPRFTEGESVLAFHVLYPLLNESSNQSATVLAESVGTERYVRLMNDKATAIGMAQTTFADPSGVLATNTATAEDLARLAQYLYYNRPFVLNLLAGRLDPGFYDAPQFNDLSNFNIFSDDEAFVGGKVGHTKAADETMLAVFHIDIRGTSRPIAIVVLGSTNIKDDVNKIRDYIAERYR
ncbi:hypothetical protein A3C87_00240 [Candidatus Kaiserbacteria bacterium RIFCSPHIGHO2_02_FULL_49_34]|uniref:L,D-TPase catalytic domain-containing protein n=1 Tax=Candidatus Kaiserbacteria bacterium RIFCSPHIGHO2_02_FULL_49_34 TaxID=1798491 RepID=A0A1F6DK62_9BACT|nr:MAG: hypothetical protein A3C87_00240 [Candidatus Kaiserbacteria bacterium RIFCSPHIGHO2_02_FULL_49_34]